MSEEKTAVSKQVNCTIIVTDNLVVFPGQVVAIPVSHTELMEKVYAQGGKLFITAPKDSALQANQSGEVYDIGTIGHITEIIPEPEGETLIVFAAESRGRLRALGSDGFAARVEVVQESDVIAPELQTLAKAAFAQFIAHLEKTQGAPAKLLMEEPRLKALKNTSEKNPQLLSDQMASFLNLDTAQKVNLLQITDAEQRLEYVLEYITEMSQLADLARKIKANVSEKMEKTQKEWYLREQMSAIKKELGEGGDSEDELDKLAKKIQEAGMTAEARKKCEGDLKSLRQMNPTAQEANVIRTYLEWMTSIPWNQKSEVAKDLQRAKEILDEDHYGLDEVKEHILEYLAVQKRSEKVKGDILCLVGPPGVGKTSLGKSIARATGREFLRISLGGVHSEADIRGHRRTYVGAQPGRIITSMKKAKTTNPMIQFDEIDKESQGASMNGDPSAAMLEVLDPEQNCTFHDNYLDVDYDLSNSMMVCTANDLSTIPGPLRDRMEIIEIEGYTEEEKVEIAKRHLVRKAANEAGLKEAEFSITDEALSLLIKHYTMEAGVRNLARQLSNLARKALMDIDKGHTESVTVTPESLEKYLGPKKFENDMAEAEATVGRVNGLYVAGASGGILPLEGVMFSDPGHGGAEATGSLKDVMKESVSDAYAYVRAHAQELGIPAEDFQNKRLHIKAGAGATPKDGPSAGLAIATVITSLMTQIPVRADVAMTGEISVTGKSMPIGGLKQKLRGAFEAGIRTALVPVSNVKDLEEVAEKVKQSLEIIPVASEMEVLKKALVRMPTPLTDVKPAEEKVAGVDGGQLQEAFAKALAQVMAVKVPVPANDTMPPAAALQEPAPAARVQGKGTQP